MADLNKQKYQILNFQMNLLDIKRVCDEFEKHDISPILIKGLSAALNYPKPFQRNFSDIDLAVAPESFEKSSAIIRKNNFNVDLHRGLRHLDVVDWHDLFENSRVIEFQNLKIRVLRPEDNLRVLCIHWLTDGGADRSRLWDIYFAVSGIEANAVSDSKGKFDFGRADGGEKNRAFDWDRFFGVVDDRRKIWLVVVLLAAKEYLGMPLNIKVEKTALEKLPDELADWIKNELENEWSSDHRLIPLKKVFLKDKKAFMRQLKKRFPPNVLQSIIETDSEMKIDKFYVTNFRGFLTRSKNSIKDLMKIIGGK